MEVSCSVFPATFRITRQWGVRPLVQPLAIRVGLPGLTLEDSHLRLSCQSHHDCMQGGHRVERRLAHSVAERCMRRGAIASHKEIGQWNASMFMAVERGITVMA